MTLDLATLYSDLFDETTLVGTTWRPLEGADVLESFGCVVAQTILPRKLTLASDDNPDFEVFVASGRLYPKLATDDENIVADIQSFLLQASHVRWRSQQLIDETLPKGAGEIWKPDSNEKPIASDFLEALPSQAIACLTVAPDDRSELTGDETYFKFLNDLQSRERMDKGANQFASFSSRDDANSVLLLGQIRARQFFAVVPANVLFELMTLWQRANDNHEDR